MRNNLYKYKKFRNQIQPGDALTWEGNNSISRIIRLKTHRSHASSCVSKVMADQERRLIIEADQGEVNVRLLSVKLSDYNGKCFLHKLKSRYHFLRPAIERFLWRQVGKKYGYGTLLKNVFKRADVNPRSFICSELTGASYHHPQGKKYRLSGGFGYASLIAMLREEEDNKYLRLLLRGKVLRPGGIALLPFFEPEKRIL